MVFPSCWTFASYGGWRDLEVLVLEPCSGYPLSVADGVEAGTHQRLAAGQVVETRIVATPFRGLRGVAYAGLDGTVVEAPD